MKKAGFLVLFAVFVIGVGCESTHRHAASQIKNTMTQLSQQISTAGYRNIFAAGNDNLMDSLWLSGANVDTLKAIVQDNNTESLTRLLASEILYVKDSNYPPSNWDEIMARVYTDALALTGVDHKAQLNGNMWGFMYLDSSQKPSYGTLGEHLMHTGKVAVPYLVKLLNNTQHISYIGSEDATVGNSMNCRVKDAAAYYIGQLNGIKIPFHESFTERDAEIEQLKKQLTQ